MHQPSRCLQRPRVVDSWGSRTSWRGWVDCGQPTIPFVDDTDSEVDRTRRLCRLVKRAKVTLADNKQTSWLGLERERWASHFCAQGRRILVSVTFWAPRGFRRDSQRSSRARIKVCRCKICFLGPSRIPKRHLRAAVSDPFDWI